MANSAFSAAAVATAVIEGDGISRYGITGAIDAYNTLADSDDYFDQELAEELLEACPGIMNYDRKGNWVGQARGESVM